MKINYSIVSTDDNPLYSDFWPIVKKVWWEKIKIKPVLVHICNENDVLINDDCIIHKIKKVDSINTGFQSQIARMYVTKYYPDEICIISDIDMIPLNFNYFNETVKGMDDNSLVIMTNDAYNSPKRFPMCYNVAKGNTFNEILEIEDSFEDFCKKLHNLNWGWDTDELYFGMMVDKFFNKEEKIIKLNRGYEGWNLGQAPRRIDRAMWTYDENLVKEDYYIDSHCLRPYKEFKTEIDNLVNLLSEK